MAPPSPRLRAHADRTSPHVEPGRSNVGGRGRRGGGGRGATSAGVAATAAVELRTVGRGRMRGLPRGGAPPSPRAGCGASDTRLAGERAALADGAAGAVPASPSTRERGGGNPREPAAATRTAVVAAGCRLSRVRAADDAAARRPRVGGPRAAACEARRGRVPATGARVDDVEWHRRRHRERRRRCQHRRRRRRTVGGVGARRGGPARGVTTSDFPSTWLRARRWTMAARRGFRGAPSARPRCVATMPSDAAEVLLRDWRAPAAMNFNCAPPAHGDAGRDALASTADEVIGLCGSARCGSARCGAQTCVRSSNAAAAADALPPRPPAQGPGQVACCDDGAAICHHHEQRPEWSDVLLEQLGADVYPQLAGRLGDWSQPRGAFGATFARCAEAPGAQLSLARPRSAVPVA